MFNLSIGITTFEHRFDKYFVPLVNQIRTFAPEVEIVVAVNGENRQEFSESYRVKILEFCSKNKKVFPIFFPQFRGLSKLWNTIIIHSSEEHILMLNDDVAINDGKFLEKTLNCISENDGRSFTITSSFCHFVISKREIEQIGYFDERLLGIGEEDGDFLYRYNERMGRGLQCSNLPCFGHACEGLETYKPTNIKCHNSTKYSMFNQDFIVKEKYKPDTDGFKGIWSKSMSVVSECPQQYPNEIFYRHRKGEL